MAITRRNFVKLAGVSIASLSFGSLLSACSSTRTLTEGVSVTGNANEVVVSMTVNSEPAAGFDPLFRGDVASTFMNLLFSQRLLQLMLILILSTTLLPRMSAVLMNDLDFSYCV